MNVVLDFKVPRSSVLQWAAEDLEYLEAYYVIRNNKERFKMPKVDVEKMSASGKKRMAENQTARLKRLFNMDAS